MTDPSQQSLSDDEDATEPGPAPEELEELAFEDAIEELEAIVQELEEGDLPLEEAMDRFERGLGLVTACRGKLEQAELKVEELIEEGTTRELDEPG